ncbi:MAG: hypothetical protein WCB68_02790 [Pyrinomonadaceae bacterium]
MAESDEMHVAGLRLLDQNIEFPVSASTPFIGASCGNHLHLLTLDQSRQHAQHVALDEKGRLAGEAKGLPLIYPEGLAVCADSLVLIGKESVEGQPFVFELNAGAEILWQSLIPVEDSQMVSPKLACAGERIFLLWATGSKRSALCVAEIKNRAFEEVVRFEFEDAIFDLHAVAATDGLTVACVHGESATRLELLRIFDERITQSAIVKDATQPVSADLALKGDECVLLWITKPEHELRLQRFDSELRPVESSTTLASATGGKKMHAARMFQGADARLAVSYQTVGVADDWMMISEEGEADRYEPARTFEQYVAAYDWVKRTAGEFQRVGEPPFSYAASGWAGNSLLLVSAGLNGLSIYLGEPGV